jgi:hypothetical protein
MTPYKIIAEMAAQQYARNAKIDASIEAELVAITAAHMAAQRVAVVRVLR